MWCAERQACEGPCTEIIERADSSIASLTHFTYGSSTLTFLLLVGSAIVIAIELSLQYIRLIAWFGLTMKNSRFCPSSQWSGGGQSFLKC